MIHSEKQTLTEKEQRQYRRWRSESDSGSTLGVILLLCNLTLILVKRATRHNILKAEEMA